MDPAPIDGVNNGLRDVNTKDAGPTGGDYGRSWQSDVAKADDGDMLEGHGAGFLGKGGGQVGSNQRRWQ